MSEPLELTVREVQKIADSLREPDADVFPQLIIVTPWEVKIIDADVRNDREKTLLFRYVLPDLCTKLKAHTVINLGMAWALKLPLGAAANLQRDADGGMTSPEGPIRKHPDRTEILLVSEVTADSTATYAADVARTANMPPLFGALHAFDGGENFLLRHAQRALRGNR